MNLVSAPPRLRLLGQFRLELETGTVELGRNGQRLLAYLGLRGHVSRTVLAGTLWPEVTEGHARGSLRTTLWKLPPGEPPLIGCRGTPFRSPPLSGSMSTPSCGRPCVSYRAMARRPGRRWIS